MKSILCIEDSPEVIAILKATLQGHSLCFTSSLKEAERLVNHSSFSIVLLDIELPDGNGLKFMASVQDILKHTPVFFLTGNVDFSVKTEAFSLGAEDFILKPFDPKELKLRVESKIRKTSQALENKIEFSLGKLICNIQEQRLYQSLTREAIELTSLEYRIFTLLAQKPLRIFSRSEILERVWGNSVSVTDRAVDVHVSNLRKKLTGNGVTIEATAKVGYQILVEDSKNSDG